MPMTRMPPAARALCAAALSAAADPAPAEGPGTAEAAAMVICQSPGAIGERTAALEAAGWAPLAPAGRDAAVARLAPGKALELLDINDGLPLAEAYRAARDDLGDSRDGTMGATGFRAGWFAAGTGADASYLLLAANDFMAICDIALAGGATAGALAAMTGLAPTSGRPLPGGSVTILGTPAVPRAITVYEPEAGAFAALAAPAVTMVSLRWVGSG